MKKNQNASNFNRFSNKTGRKELKSLANIKKVTLQGGDYY